MRYNITVNSEPNGGEYMENRELIERAIKYIDTSKGSLSDLTADTVAKEAGFSTDYFNRIFRSHTGFNVIEYARFRRISRAAVKLRQTDKNVIDIGLEAGYDSHDGFTRAFRAQYGMTPSEYRAAMNENSWKMALRATIDYCMTRVMNQDEFQTEMKKFGYEMTWTASRKNITYICRTDDGKERHVRDIKLNDEKYLKENMENEFRIRTELYGQAEDEKYPSSTSGGNGRNSAGTRGGAGDSDDSDQRRGLEPPVSSGTATASAFDGSGETERQYEDFGRELRLGNDESGTGTDGLFGESDTENSERSDQTGWECERESFKNHRKKHLSGRSHLVSPSRPHVSANNLDLSLMAVRGLADVMSVFDGEEESEEEKQRREAQNTGATLGALAGIAVGAAIGFMRSENDSVEDIAEEDSENFDMTM